MIGYRTIICAVFAILTQVCQAFGIDLVVILQLFGVTPDQLADMAASGQSGLINSGVTIVLLIGVVVFKVLANRRATATLAATQGNKASGFVRWAILPLLIVFSLMGTAFIVTGCAGGAVQTKNQAQALSYYTIGQGYDGIDAAFLRGDISMQTARTLTLQVDLTRSLLDLARSPSSKSVQDTLLATSGSLSALTINGQPALSAGQLDMVNKALAVAAAATNGTALPSANDTAGWLMLGSDVLRTVGAATAKH